MSIEAPASPQALESPPSGSETGSRPGWLLAVCCVAQFMVILDLSIVNVALPSIQLSLGFSSTDLQWVVDAYTITFAGFLLLGGRAVDHFGQRRMLVTALLVFGLASLAGGAAPDRGLLIGARAAQGIAGALMAASSLAIITSSFPPGPKLHRAVSTWAAMNGLGGAAGVLLGGIITQALTWRWVLLINPPIAVVASIVAYAVVHGRRQARDGARFDVAGALTLTVGQMVLVYGVVEAGLAGWDATKALGPIILGAALLVAFVVIETRIASAPLVPFKDLTKPLRIANNVVLLFSAALFPMWIVSSLYLQQVLGLSPLVTGLDVPADDVDDHAGRLARRQAGEPVRRAPGARRRPDHVDRRHAAARADRIQRQRGRVRDDPGAADGRGDRDVDRALDDRGHAGRQGGSGRARLGHREHLASGGRGPRARDPGHARDPAHVPPDRHRRFGQPGADGRVPPGLPDRRRAWLRSPR